MLLPANQGCSFRIALLKLGVLARAIVKKTLERFRATVTRKAQMTNAAVLLLLDEVIRNAPLLVQIDFDGCLIDVVEQVEVEVFGTAFGQLFFEDRGGIIDVGDLVARILGGEEVAIAWITAQSEWPSAISDIPP